MAPSEWYAGSGVVVVGASAGGLEALEELLRGRVDPAVVFDRPHDERGLVLDKRLRELGRALPECARGGDAVNLAGGKLDDALFVLHAKLGDFEVFGEVDLFVLSTAAVIMIIRMGIPR